jgi:hypothetical protein
MEEDDENFQEVLGAALRLKPLNHEVGLLKRKHPPEICLRSCHQIHC